MRFSACRQPLIVCPKPHAPQGPRTRNLRMTQVGQDALGTRSTMTVGGKEIAYYSLRKAGEKLGDISRLPFSMKVLLENLLRFEDGGFTVSTADIQALIDWQRNPKESQ